MPYVLPTFNQFVNVWRHGISPLVGDPALTSPCALVYGRRSQAPMVYRSALPNQFTSPPLNVMTMDLLLPELTDIRGQQDTIGNDCVEVPAGSGRYYWSITVDDIGKGWPNEHRLSKIGAVLGTWLAPYL